MTSIAQFASLAEVRQRIDLVDRQLVALIAAFIDGERLHQAALHPPSPQPN